MKKLYIWVYAKEKGYIVKITFKIIFLKSSITKML